MNTQLLNAGIKIGMTVHTVDGAHVGTVAAVWPDSELDRSSAPATAASRTDAEVTDPEMFTFSEGMPGGGDAYFSVRTPEGGDLYVPFTAVAQAEGEAVEVAVDHATIPGLQWDIIPDFLNITTETDSQGGPHVA